MVKNLYTAEAEAAVELACVVNELRILSEYMPGFSEAERVMCVSLMGLVKSHIPDEIMELVQRERVLQKAHVMLIEQGFSAWNLCAIRKLRKK